MASVNARERQVLRTVIEAHVASGEPVGSDLVASRMKRTVSPATIRNIMGRLERLGLLEQPHTSAGRVPTDEGYRLHVDSLLAEAEYLPSREAAEIDMALQPGRGTPSQLFENASQLLSRLSHKVAFAFAEENDRARVRQVEFVRLTHPRVLAVIVYRSGLVTQCVIEVEEQLSQDQLQACANYINHSYAGCSLATMHARLIELMSRDEARRDALLRRIVAVGNGLIAAVTRPGTVYLDGRANILDQSETADLEDLRTLMRTIEENSRLLKILNACLDVKGLRILIGHENPHPDFRHMSIVSTSYGFGEDNGWALGVIGSTRMAYPRVIALVGHVGLRVQSMLAEMGS